MNIQVNSHGIFREVRSFWEFTLEGKAKVSDLRKAFHHELKITENERLIPVLVRSAFARRDNILVDADAVADAEILDILPPVGGG